MKKLALLTLALLLSYASIAQIIGLKSYSIANSNTQIGAILPAGTTIYNVADDVNYRLLINSVSTYTLNTAGFVERIDEYAIELTETNADSLAVHLDTLQAHSTLINTNLTNIATNADSLQAHSTLINTKAPLASPNFTCDVSITGDIDKLTGFTSLTSATCTASTVSPYWGDEVTKTASNETTFTVDGDQTSEFIAGDSVYIDVNGGTSYDGVYTIISSVYTSSTVVTIPPVDHWYQQYTVYKTYITDVGTNISLGNNNIATGAYSTSLGIDNTSSGNYSITLGDGNTASGSNSTAIGIDNIAHGVGIAIGNSNNTGGFAFGYNNRDSITSQNTSYIIGSSNIIRQNILSGSPFVLGYGNEIDEYGMALGRNLILKNQQNTIIGQFNDTVNYSKNVGKSTWGSDSLKPLFVVSNGQNIDNRSNALVLNKIGDLSIASNITAATYGAASVTDTELGYLDGVTSNIQTQLNSAAPSYMIYLATLTQSGTDDPVVVVRQNTLDSAVTVTRTATGAYKIACAQFQGENPDYYKAFMSPLRLTSELKRYTMRCPNPSYIEIYTYDDYVISPAVASDGLLNRTEIEIKVFE